MAATLREEDDAVNATHPPGSRTAEGGVTRVPRSGAKAVPGTFRDRTERRIEICLDPVLTPGAAPGLLPSPRHDGSNTDTIELRAHDAPVTSDFTPSATTTGNSYLLAALSPASPAPPSVSPLPRPIPLLHSGCYRCLATDHQVRQCRDPVRCRLCRRTASATPTPPPTPLNLPPVTTAFDPLRMLASSSSGPAMDIQLPVRTRDAATDETPYFLGDLFREPVDTGKRPVQDGARRAPQAASPAIPKARDICMLPSFTWPSTPQLRFQLLPSSRGVALLHFGSAEAREAAMHAQPIQLNGTVVRLERVESTDDRFIREPAWLAHVAAWNFPEEHWAPDKVREIYKCLGTVMEIDPFSIPGFDRSCMRFVLELQHPHVPARIGVHPPSGRGIVLRQSILSLWPREQQFDAAGNWIPYHGPAPPPPPAPAHAPANGQQPAPAPARNNPQPDAPAPHMPAPPGAGHDPQDALHHATPLHPAAFLGAAILCHGFINAFPLPRLPPLPIIIHLPSTAVPAHSVCRAQPVLLFTWRERERDALPDVHAPTPLQNTPPPAAEAEQSECWEGQGKNKEQRTPGSQGEWEIRRFHCQGSAAQSLAEQPFTLLSGRADTCS
ncbi:unnamed protein product [Miscanthus lutarioriparius]|uniref:Uncharacterized protein n=1 Tax=Miscanthus lutarioriparius TaxID=422564 RepID=A0A811P3B0_9POAL|nr:unnamed protein product [Miscanthus lutarioriparius]